MEPCHPSGYGDDGMCWVENDRNRLMFGEHLRKWTGSRNAGGTVSVSTSSGEKTNEMAMMTMRGRFKGGEGWRLTRKSQQIVRGLIKLTEDCESQWEHRAAEDEVETLNSCVFSPAPLEQTRWTASVLLLFGW